MVAGFLVLIVAFSFGVWANSKTAADARDAIVTSGRAVAVDGCNRDYVDRQQLRKIFTTSMSETKAIYKSGEITKKRYMMAMKFYKNALNDLALPDCRNALNLITADPNRPVKVPVPKW